MDPVLAGPLAPELPPSFDHGRRHSGRVYEIPVAYRQHGSAVTINVGAPDRKQWWRNFRIPSTTRLQIRGDNRVGFAEAGRTKPQGLW